MSDAQARRFLTTGTRAGKPAVVRADGSPMVAPVWFDLDDDGRRQRRVHDRRPVYRGQGDPARRTGRSVWTIRHRPTATFEWTALPKCQSAPTSCSAGRHALPAGTWALTVYIVRAMDGRITYWNRGAEELYGWIADEAFGRVAPELLHATYPGPLPTSMQTHYEPAPGRASSSRRRAGESASSSQAGV